MTGSLPDRVHPWPRVSFGIIVLNGEPFIEHNLRSLYTFAHQIIVVEGAVHSAAANATPDGHSLDSTLATVRRFQATQDPEHKVQLITIDGFWEEKDAMSVAYADAATGDWLWQVDVDEFYMPEQMAAFLADLAERPDVTGAAFDQITFWGSPDVVVDGWYLRCGARYYQRLFRWGPGYRYTTHRPPTVVDADGNDLTKGRFLSGPETRASGIRLLHYSLLFPRQVIEKERYYETADWNPYSRLDAWVKQTYLGLERPFAVHNVPGYPSWLERYRGAHPPEIAAMWQHGAHETRPMGDVDVLLRQWRYRVLRQLLRWVGLLSCYTGLPRRTALWLYFRLLQPLIRAAGYAQWTP
jgi:hypothetical protein